MGVRNEKEEKGKRGKKKIGRERKRKKKKKKKRLAGSQTVVKGKGFPSSSKWT